MSNKHTSDASQVGEGFRWSWDEIKSIFKRPFSNPNADTNSGGSLFRFSKDGQPFRWSFEGLKAKIRQSRNPNKVPPSSKAKRKRDEPATMNPAPAQLGHPLTDKEKRQRVEERKKKKSQQEAIRRQKVKEHFVKLGNMLGVENPESKAAKVQILAAAKEKLLSKKGISPQQRMQLQRILEMDLDLEDDDMDMDGML